GTIAGGIATFSKSWTPAAIGTYYWIADYAGDANNKPFTTSCGDANEQLYVVKASPTITTLASPTTTVAVGTPVTIGDTATIKNGNNPTGSITFTLYSNNTCTTPAGVSGSGVITNGTASYSTTWTPPAAGTYYWIASYPGDAKNNAFTTKCNDPNEKITAV